MKKIISTIIIVLIVIGAVFVLKPNNNNKTKVGVITPLTGFAASYGEEMRKGILDANTSNIDFVFEDDNCDPAKAVGAFQKLAEIDKVKAIIGPGCGSPQEAIAPIIKNKDIVAFLPSAASRNLYNISNGKMYNVQYALEDEASYIANEVYKLGYKNVLIISYKNAFSKVHADSFKVNFKGNIVKTIEYNDANSDISTELTKIKGIKFDAIFSTDISFFLGQGMRKLKDYNINVPVFSSYIIEMPAIRQFVEGVIYSFPSNLGGQQGATYELSKYAAELISKEIGICGGDTSCITNSIRNSGLFDKTGVSTRSFMLKQIKNGEIQTK